MRVVIGCMLHCLMSFKRGRYVARNLVIHGVAKSKRFRKVNINVGQGDTKEPEG